MVMGACPWQIPISCVILTLMVTATMVRACRYMHPEIDLLFSAHISYGKRKYLNHYFPPKYHMGKENI